MSKKVFVLGMMAFLSWSVPETKAADFGFSLFGPQGGQFSFYNGSSFSNRAHQYRRPVYPSFHYPSTFCMPRYQFQSNRQSYQYRSFTSQRYRSRSSFRSYFSQQSFPSFWGF